MLERMTLKELDDTFDFHDSSIQKIISDKENKRLIMLIDFCYWMQKDFIEGSIENGIISLTFENVSNYSWINGQIDDYTILGIEVFEKKICFNIVDEFHDKFFRVSFNADEVFFGKECEIKV